MSRRSMGLPPNRAQGSQYPPMVRENSLYNLNFDEVQSQLGNTGKPIHDINLDELHKSVISGESGHLGQDPSSNHHSFLLGNMNVGMHATKANSISETWRESVDQQHMNRSVDTLLKQPSLEEKSLENFLAHGGVINVAYQNINVDTPPLMGMDSVMLPPHLQQQWMPIPSNVHQPHHEPRIIENCHSTSQSFYDSHLGYSDNSVGIPMSPSFSDAKSALDLYKKRKISDEIERRQKRMAKNRESAARSRAKKQEHITRLENEKCRLQKLTSWRKMLKVHSAIHIYFQLNISCGFYVLC
ncbi:unnamed protein product [Sphenostylis stenocarpa]|uniref:BZIP domain-containing protein n=1 Tax=Sphenostylis stenocarpa TaxID=92480 RepID=A0AA86VKL6_9FABA|nr:unnamed protein product [Sphenostylis stenocarpa]